MSRDQPENHLTRITQQQKFGNHLQTVQTHRHDHRCTADGQCRILSFRLFGINLAHLPYYTVNREIARCNLR